MAEMMPQSALVPDSDYVIIGGTGDLALRKIFPALFWRFLDGQVTSAFGWLRLPVNRSALRNLPKNSGRSAVTRLTILKQTTLRLMRLFSLFILSGWIF